MQKFKVYFAYETFFEDKHASTWMSENYDNTGF